MCFIYPGQCKTITSVRLWLLLVNTRRRISSLLIRCNDRTRATFQRSRWSNNFDESDPTTRKKTLQTFKRKPHVMALSRVAGPQQLPWLSQIDIGSLFQQRHQLQSGSRDTYHCRIDPTVKILQSRRDCGCRLIHFEILPWKSHFRKFAVMDFICVCTLDK